MTTVCVARGLDGEVAANELADSVIDEPAPDWEEIRHDLEPHLVKEEQVQFSMIRELDSANRTIGVAAPPSRGRGRRSPMWARFAGGCSGRR